MRMPDSVLLNWYYDRVVITGWYYSYRPHEEPDAYDPHPMPKNWIM